MEGRPTPTLCIVCCIAYPLTRERSNEVVDSSIISLLKELDLIGTSWQLLVRDSVCPDCFRNIQEAITKQANLREVECEVLKLQSQLIKLLQELQGKLADVQKQWKQLEDSVEQADTSCLTWWIRSKRYSSDVIVIRERLVQGARNLSAFRDDLCQKLGVSELPGIKRASVIPSEICEVIQNLKRESIIPSEICEVVQEPDIVDDLLENQNNNYNSVSPVTSNLNQGSKGTNENLTFFDDSRASNDEDDAIDEWFPEAQQSDSSSSSVEVLNFNKEKIGDNSESKTGQGSSTTLPKEIPKRSRKSKSAKELDGIRTKRKYTKRKGLDDSSTLPSYAKLPWKERIIKTVIIKASTPIEKRKRRKEDGNEYESRRELVDRLPSFLATYSEDCDLLTYGDVPIILNEQSRTVACGRCSFISPVHGPFLVIPHVFREHLDGLKCPDCFKTFKSLKRITRHYYEVHSMLDSCTCEICGKTLKTKKALPKHKLTHFSEEEKQEYYREIGRTPPVEPVTKDFQCSKCSRAFRKKSWCDRHELTHEENRERVMCAECGSMVLDIVCHRRTCKSIERERPPIQCIKCSSAFLTLRRLKTHMKVVHSERTIRCSICPDSHPGFKSAASLYTHMKYHDEAKLACSKGCGCTFKSSYSLKRHEKSCRGIPAAERKHPGRPRKLGL